MYFQFSFRAQQCHQRFGLFFGNLPLCSLRLSFLDWMTHACKITGFTSTHSHGQRHLALGKGSLLLSLCFQEGRIFSKVLQRSFKSSWPKLGHKAGSALQKASHIRYSSCSPTVHSFFQVLTHFHPSSATRFFCLQHRSDQIIPLLKYCWWHPFAHWTRSAPHSFPTPDRSAQCMRMVAPARF